MATIEELEERIERLEKIVEDEIEYPQIVHLRDNRNDELDRIGIKVLKEPPKPPVELLFENRFHPAMEKGDKTVTFRHTKHGKVGDIFAINGTMYKIREIREMSLKSFVSMFWDDDGFDSIDDAVEWFNRHYLTQGGNPLDFSKVHGYMHRFERYETLNRRFTR